MSANMFLFLSPLFWLLNNSDGAYVATASVPAGVELKPPKNVTIISLNTNYTLMWDWSPDPEETTNATFTTQFVGAYELKSKNGDPDPDPDWVTVCEGSSARSCDLTGLMLHYLGSYVFRVSANRNGRHSKWVQVEFCPESHADLGPPFNVELRPAGNLIDVQISEPRSSQNTGMKQHVDKLFYRVRYWEHSRDGKPSEIQQLNTSVTFVTLPGLKPWTRYCVSVQSRTNDDYRKSSSFTLPRCVQTEGHLPWWQIFLYFLSSLLVFLLLLLLLFWCFFKSCMTLKNTWFPSSRLPTHLEQYLCRSPQSQPPPLLTAHSELELLCDKVSICAPPVVQVDQNLACGGLMELSNSRRHSRQGSSSSSGDSGVYSAGGSSTQPSIKLQAQPRATTFDHGPCKDASRDLRGPLLIAEAGGPG